MPVGVLLADGHAILRRTVKSLLIREGFSVVAECAGGLDAVGLAEKLHPDVAVLDVSVNGFGTALEIRRVSACTKVVVFTMHWAEQYVVEAMSAGVNAYVLKSDPPTALPEAIRAVYRGETYLSPRLPPVAVHASA